MFALVTITLIVLFSDTSLYSMPYTHREKEEEIVAAAIKMAKLNVGNDIKTQVKNTWNRHKHQLSCTLCSTLAIDADDDDDQYWGECVHKCPELNVSTSIVLCPECLSSKWTLYKRKDFKIASPIFHDQLTVTDMKWESAMADEVPQYLKAEIEIDNDRQSLNPIGLMAELREQTGLQNVTKEQITRWQAFPRDHFVRENPMYDPLIFPGARPPGPHRNRIDRPTFFRAIILLFFQRYSRQFLGYD